MARLVTNLPVLEELQGRVQTVTFVIAVASDQETAFRAGHDLRIAVAYEITDCSELCTTYGITTPMTTTTTVSPTQCITNTVCTMTTIHPPTTVLHKEVHSTVMTRLMRL